MPPFFLPLCPQYCALHKQVTAVAAALRAGGDGGSGDDGGGGGGEGPEGEGVDTGRAGSASGAAGGAWAHLTAARRAELLRRGSEASRQLAALRKEFGNRQRLVSGGCGAVCLQRLPAALGRCFCN